MLFIPTLFMSLLISADGVSAELLEFDARVSFRGFALALGLYTLQLLNDVFPGGGAGVPHAKFSSVCLGCLLRFEADCSPYSSFLLS